MTEKNPYLTPTPVTHTGSYPPVGSPGMVQQIRVVAILMMAHGILSILTGLFYGAMGFAMPMVMDAQMRPGNAPAEFDSPRWLIIGMYAAMGAPAVVAGGLQILAGAYNYDLRGRTLGIVGAAAGLLAASTCYCAPTGIALAIYGLIVLLNPTVAEAFQRRGEGATAASVLAYFAQVSRGTLPPASAQSPPASAQSPPAEPRSPGEPPQPNS